MPKILEDRRQAIARNNPNLSKSSTYAIATSALQKEGKMPKAKGYQDGGGVVDDPLAKAVNRVTPSGGRPYSTFLQEPRVGELAPKASLARQKASVDANVRRAQEDTDAMRSDMQKAYKQRGFNKGGSVGGGMTTHNYCAGGKVLSTRKY